MTNVTAYFETASRDREADWHTICGSRQASFATARARVAALVAGLKAPPVSLGAGDRICILANNSDRLLEVYLAILALGAVIVPLNTRWGLEEKTYAVQLCQPQTLICNQGFRQEVPQGNVPVVVLGDAPDDACMSTEQLIAGNRVAGNRFQISAPVNDQAAIIFTSGTSGPAKGVCVTHTALAFQVEAKIARHTYGKEVYLHALPLCHVGGLVMWLAMLRTASTHILMEKYEPEQLLALVAEHSVTSLIAVPAVVIDILRSSNQGQASYDSVRHVLLGGGGLHQNLHLPLRRTFPKATIWTAYGMTECTSSITTLELRSQEVQPHIGTLVGHPLDGVEVAIGTETAAPATKELISTAASLGEVLTRGPHVSARYFRDPEASSAAYLPGGWFRTGDLGHLDKSGRLWLAGRLKDVIRTGSENVSAAEVEMVLMHHPEIQQAAVVGMPHPRLGEQVAALIQVKPTTDAGRMRQNDIARFCHDRGLAHFKAPKLAVLQNNDLPANSNGKVLKHQVKRMIERSMIARSRL